MIILSERCGRVVLTSLVTHTVAVNRKHDLTLASDLPLTSNQRPLPSLSNDSDTHNEAQSPWLSFMRFNPHRYTVTLYYF